MGRVSGMNREPQLVKLMENNHSETQKELRFFLRKLLIRAPIFGVILPILIWDWFLTLGTIGINCLFYVLCYRHIKKSVYLGQVGSVMFNVSNEGAAPNMENVYNSTLIICEMRGYIKTMSKVLDIYNLCVIFFVSLNLITKIILLILGGK